MPHVIHTDEHGRRFATKQRENGGTHAGSELCVVSHEVEVAALDALGPMMRRTLDEAPIKYMAAPIVQQLRAAGLDPKNPALDHTLSQRLLRTCRDRVALDRDPRDADLSIVPLRAIGGRRRRRL